METPAEAEAEVVKDEGIRMVRVERGGNYKSSILHFTINGKPARAEKTYDVANARWKQWRLYTEEDAAYMTVRGEEGVAFDSILKADSSLKLAQQTAREWEAVLAKAVPSAEGAVQFCVADITPLRSITGVSRVQRVAQGISVTLKDFASRVNLGPKDGKPSEKWEPITINGTFHFGTVGVTAVPDVTANSDEWGELGGLPIIREGKRDVCLADSDIHYVFHMKRGEPVEAILGVLAQFHNIHNVGFVDAIEWLKRMTACNGCGRPHPRRDLDAERTCGKCLKRKCLVCEGALGKDGGLSRNGPGPNGVENPEWWHSRCSTLCKGCGAHFPNSFEASAREELAFCNLCSALRRATSWCPLCTKDIPVNQGLAVMDRGVYYVVLSKLEGVVFAHSGCVTAVRNEVSGVCITTRPKHLSANAVWWLDATAMAQKTCHGCRASACGKCGRETDNNGNTHITILGRMITLSLCDACVACVAGVDFCDRGHGMSFLGLCGVCDEDAAYVAVLKAMTTWCTNNPRAEMGERGKEAETGAVATAIGELEAYKYVFVKEEEKP